MSEIEKRAMAAMRESLPAISETGKFKLLGYMEGYKDGLSDASKARQCMDADKEAEGCTPH